MLEAFKILRFGWPYLRRYWLRFVLGVIFGLLFGLSNGFTMGGVYLILNRLGDPARVQHLAEEGRKAREAAAQKESQESPAIHTFHAAVHALHDAERSFHDTIQDVNERFYATVDPWLPRAQRPVDWKQVLGGFLLFPLLAAFRGLMNYATTYLMAWAGLRIVNDVKEDVFRKISSLSLDFFHKHTTAELMSRINDDTSALSQCLRLGLSDLIKEPSTILCLFIGLLLFDWKLTLISIAFIPLCIVPVRLISQRIKSQGRQDNTAYVQQAGLAMESFQNVRVTKAYELAGEHAKLFQKSGNRAAHFFLKTTQARSLLNPLLETISSFGIGAVLLYAIWAGIRVNVLGSFLISVVFFNTSFKKLSNIQVYFSQAGLAMERLMGLFQLQPSVREIDQPVPMSTFTRGIEFKDVGFSYGDGPILDHVSFGLSRGQRLGLAGESGSGKSSLINLLFRFYDPTSGRIEIDGVPIQSLRLSDLRFHLALVSQDILLFNTTVAENIAFGKTGATREEVITAAREAYAHDFIQELPHGYDTELGERGLRLSGGQRQRIAIARAFIRNAPILVLDEATASLDSESEAEVQKAIDHLAENRTVICVAHRLSTLRSMDKILVLQKGRVIEQGGFDQLLAQRGIFTSMAARQSIFPQAA